MSDTSDLTTPAERPAEASARPPRNPLMRLLQAIALAFVLGLLALLVWRVATEGSGSELVKAVSEGKRPPAPAWNLPVLWPHTETWPHELAPKLADGKVSLRELRGYPVVLNFWASWCVPCAREARRFVDSARAHRGRVVFIGINVNDARSDAKRFLARHDTNYVSVRGGDGPAYDDYGLTGLPETYYLDGRGRIAAHAIGEVSPAELAAGIATIDRSGS